MTLLSRQESVKVLLKFWFLSATLISYSSKFYSPPPHSQWHQFGICGLLVWKRDVQLGRQEPGPVAVGEREECFWELGARHRPHSGHWIWWGHTGTHGVQDNFPTFCLAFKLKLSENEPEGIFLLLLLTFNHSLLFQPFFLYDTNKTIVRGARKWDLTHFLLF